MADQISLGKNGNTGKIDFSRIKAGVKKEELVKNDARLESVFDMVDSDKDGTLNRTELDELQKLVSDLAGDDGNLDSKEAKNFGEQKLGRKDRKALLEFLNKLDGVTPEDVEKVETKTVNNEQVEVLTFKDGHTEVYYPSGQKISEVVQGNKKTKTTEMSGTVTSEVVTENEDEENEIISTTSTVNGQKQTVIKNKGDKTTTTINYNGNKKSDATIVGENSTTVITYDSDGNSAKEVETSGTTEKTYIYQNGQKVLQSVIENKGLEGKETTKAYDSEGGYTQTKEVGNGKITTVVDKDGNVTSNVKTEKVNGQEVSLQLDKDGNIPGVIVQNGESPAAIAKKFGCSVDELMRLNANQLKGKGKNQYFEVGSEIKLPNTVGIEKFAKAQEGRKPAEVAKAEYARDAEIRRQKAEAARQEREYYQKLGVKNFNNKGQKVKADGWGNKEFEIIGDVGYGRQLVKRDGKLYTRSHDGKILREDYLQAHKAYVSKPQNQRNNTASGIKDVTYVKDNNGKVWYFDEKTGKAIVKGNYTQIVKQESAFVANQLHTAAKGMGTDEELLEKGVKNIYSRDILQGVNAELRTKDSDYAGDAQTMPVEALILDEMSHTAARPLFKTLINSGTMTTEEQAHTVKREIEYEVHGGLTGYTSTSDLNEIMQLCSDRDLRLEIEAQFKKDHPELAENDGSVVRSYIAGDGWNAQEVDQFDANWVKTGAYQEARYVYQTDENGNVVLDKNGQPVVLVDEGDQAHRNGVIGRLVFDYQDKEALNKGLDAVNENPNSFDYQYLDQRAGQEIAKDPQGKYQSRFTNQDNVQRYLAGFHSDASGNVDAGNVSASNTCLFKGLKPARVQAEEALYNAKNGDYSQTFDSMDSEIYTAMSELIANGDIKGVKNITELYNKALSSATTQNDKTKIKANAMISGQVEFSDKEIEDFCIELMHSIDSNRGIGGSTGMSAGHTNSADYQTEQLKAILQNNPQVMDAVKARVEKENFSYTTSTTTYNGPGQPSSTTNITTNTQKQYMQLLADTKTIAKEEIFYDANGNKITDPQQIRQIKRANMQSLEQMRQYVAELERDYKKGIDAEGTLSDMANGLSEYSGLGTDRQDVATEYRNAKLMLQQFEAAAQGKLRDSQGNVISAQDLAQQMMDKRNALAETNSDYKQTIAYGKMGIVLAPVIVATTVATGGAGAAGWGTLGVAVAGGVAAGATTYGINALEYNTSYTGNTAEAREQNLEDSIVNGATTAIGIGQMKYIGSMANNMGTVARTGIRLATTVGADTGVGAAAEYATTGNVSTQGTMTNMIMSGVGNAIGAKSMGKKQPAPKAKTLDNATSQGSKPVGGSFSEKKFDQVRTEVRQELGSGVTPDRAAHIYKEADKVQIMNSKQGKALKHEVETASGFETHRKQRVVTEKKGEAVVEKINENVSRTSETILAEKNSGALAPHDAATLEDNLVNNLNTKEQIEQFKAQLKERVGADANGNMFKYEVQGKDHAADLMAKADKKLKQLADFDDVMATIPEQGGMGDLTAIKSFVNRPGTTADQLDALVAKMEANPALKKFGGTKKLIADMKTRSDILKPKNASVKTPKKEVVSDEVPSTPVKVDDKVLSPEVETPVTPQPKYTKEFEPAHNDTPVSSEIIDQRLDADNPELKKLNEEFALGNSMLQKQAAVENSIENLSYQNYSPEYVESIREKIKEISVGNPEMEKSYNELLDLAAHDASTEKTSLIREKEYIERTYGTHKSAQESAQTFSDHLEQVNAAKEDDYIRRTHQNPSGKSAAESAEVFEKELAVRDKVKATDEQLHQKTLLDGDELFERITHSDNPELQQLGAQYKKLEAQEQELQQQVERLKEQIRRKAQTSASEINSRFNRSNPELDIMNTKYRSLELQQEKLKAQVEKLKQQMRKKVSVNADDIDARLNQRTGDYEDLAADLRNREAIGQRAKKELELEKAEQAAVEREQAYIDRTYNTTHKSASESADVFNADIANKEAAQKAKFEAETKAKAEADAKIKAKITNEANAELEKLASKTREVNGKNEPVLNQKEISILKQAIQDNPELANYFIKQFDKNNYTASKIAEYCKGGNISVKTFEACVKSMEEITTILPNHKYKNLRLEEVVSIVKEHDITDINGLMNYLRNADINKLNELSPVFKSSYNDMQLDILAYYYKKGITDFTPETLTFTDNMSQFLSSNYVDQNTMIKLMRYFPLTDRNIGQFPDSWFKGLPTNERENISKQIQDVITPFSSNKWYNEGVNELQEGLSKALNKKVKVSYIGSGQMTHAYKISIDGCEDVVIKKFQVHDESSSRGGVHGAMIEPQTGFFASNHSDKFVKFYGGRVEGLRENDAYMITEFLDSKSPLKSSKGISDPNYNIDITDHASGNTIEGKIVDFGAINILDRNGNSVASYDIKTHKPKMKNIITFEEAKLQCSDDKLIALATRKDGSVNKDALDLVVKYKQLADFRDDEVKFLLEQCNGNYKKVNDLMNKIQSELDRLDLEIRHGQIGIKGLKLGEFPDMDNQQFMKKYGSALNRGNKLINGCYRIDDLMHFYLFGKGKYIDSFNSGNIMKDFDIAYGCRSVTDGYHVRYTNIREKEDDIATLMAHSLSSQPTPDQRRALGRYKGDMSESIQEGRLPQDANYIDEFLSANPLKKSINVKREDSYAILSNLKFADGVTLKDAITNPQYHDRLSQIKSLEGQSFINDRFMSTTVDSGAFGNCYVNWDLEVSEGVGATYLDILGLASEGELLLNRGLKVTIIEIGDTTPKGVVHIKAKVEKAD